MAIVTESAEAMDRINKLEAENSELKKEIIQLKEALLNHNLSFIDDVIKEDNEKDSVKIWRMTIAPEERANIPAFSDAQQFRMPGRVFTKPHDNKENLREFSILQTLKKQLEGLLLNLKNMMEEGMAKGKDWVEEGNTLSNANVKKEEWNPIKKFPLKRKEVLSMQNPNLKDYVTAQVDKSNLRMYKLPSGIKTEQKGTP